MGHLAQRDGDTYYNRGWWYRDYDDYLDTVLEYRRPEYHDTERDEDSE